MKCEGCKSMRKGEGEKIDRCVAWGKPRDLPYGSKKYSPKWCPKTRKGWYMEDGKEEVSVIYEAPAKVYQMPEV